MVRLQRDPTTNLERQDVLEKMLKKSVVALVSFCNFLDLYIGSF